MINSTVVGNLGADPEQRNVSNGKSLVQFRVGARVGRDETNWVKCTIWGNRGDTFLQYVKKGDQVTLIGRMRQVEYERKDGNTGYALELDVDNFTLPARQKAAANATPDF